jgi:Ala-tRNA(Pro) deacylase
MMVLPGDYQLDLHAAQEMIGSTHATLAPEEELATLFPDCEVGAMPPFGSLYQMDVYVEKEMSDDEEIEFHAGSHQDAIRMSYAKWQEAVHPKTGHFSHKMH